MKSIFNGAGLSGTTVLGSNTAVLALAWTGVLDNLYKIGQLAVVVASLVATYWLIRKTKAQALVAEHKQKDEDSPKSPYENYRNPLPYRPRP